MVDYRPIGDNIDLLASLTAVGEQIICKTLDANTLFCSLITYHEIWKTMGNNGDTGNLSIGGLSLTFEGDLR